jgi:hypothetical protein
MAAGAAQERSRIAMLPEIGALYRFWRDAKEGGTLPTRRALGPETLRPWLGSLSIYEHLREGDDFRIRLDGTKIVAMTGEDWTGRLVSEIDRRFGADLLGCCREVCRLHLPLFDSALPLFQKSYRCAQRLLLPLSRDGAEATQVLMALVALKLDPAAGARPENRRLVLPG